MTKPTVGRVVHYMAYGTPGGEYPSVERAAIVTEVYPDDHAKAGQARLAVFNPTGMHFNDAPYSEERKPGTWAWPPRA